MRKIETIFKRDPANMKLVLNAPNDSVVGIENPCWVFDGHGVPTIKIDGTCCLIKGGALYRRHNLKVGQPFPPGWFHWSENPEQRSGHGWIPISDGPADAYHREVWSISNQTLLDGTYELVGESVNGNPHRVSGHALWKHGEIIADYPPDRTFEAIKEWLTHNAVEGIVWWWVRPGGTWGDKDTLMAKIKRRDFGIPWPEKP